MASEETRPNDEEEQNDPTAEAIAQLESELLTGDWEAARETLDKLEERPGQEGASYAELGPAIDAIAKDDDEGGLLHLLELRHHRSEVDEALYNLVATRLEESDYRLLAAGAFEAIRTRHGLGEHARCLQTLGLDEEEWAAQFSEAMEELLRDHLSRHAESALGWEALAKYLARRPGGADEASEAARRAIAIDPQRWTARAVDVSLSTDENRKAAQVALLQSIAETEDPPAAVIDYGLGCALELERHSEAQKLLERLPADTPEAMEVLGDLAPRARQRRALDLAIKYVADSPDALTLALLEDRFDGTEAEGALARIAAQSLLDKGEELSAAACLLHGGEAERKRAAELIEAQDDEELDPTQVALERLLGIFSHRSEPAASRLAAHAALLLEDAEKAEELARAGIEEGKDGDEGRTLLARALLLAHRLKQRESEEEGDDPERIEPPAELLELLEELLPRPDVELLVARAEVDPDPERALEAAKRVLAIDPLHHETLKAAARRLRQLDRYDELADHITFMVSLDHADMETVMRARQAVQQTHGDQANGESSIWGKVVIVGAAIALVLLIIKGYC